MATAGGVLGLSACSKPAAFSCMDTTGLPEDDIAKRTQFQYVDATPRPGMVCSNCQFYQAPTDGQCGGCTMFAGGVHPQGWCSAWAARS
jgi:hypothetical protein